ncbi:MAG: hypothetical protein KIT09_31275 [Bryobacteraceae bacterium]|nr:hypothetical protein [Bryobacteraceae bacterium]
MANLEPYDEAAVMRTVDESYTGIQATLTLPSKYSIGPVTKASSYTHYFNFYLGFSDELEAGISHSRKETYSPDLDPVWRTFSYSYKDKDHNFALQGLKQKYHLKIVVDEQRMSEFYLDGNLVARIVIPRNRFQVKMCFATQDQNSAFKHQVYYDSAIFQLLGIRTLEGQKRPHDPKGWLDRVACEKLQWTQKYVPSTDRVPRMSVGWGLSCFRTSIQPPTVQKLREHMLQTGPARPRENVAGPRSSR